MRDNGVLEFAGSSQWSARNFASAARREQDHCLRIGSPRLEIYSQAVADTVFHILGDHGLVQQSAAMSLILQRQREMGLL